MKTEGYVGMGYYVHLHVAFNCNENDDVAELARKHSRRLEDASVPSECLWFLENLSARTGQNPGPKGGLSLWGIVGNKTDVNGFIDFLKDFWLDLLSGEVDGGPCDHEHIIVFYENEGSERAHCYEIALTDRCRRQLGYYYESRGSMVVSGSGCRGSYRWVRWPSRN
jgi:hypothetical protein